MRAAIGLCVLAMLVVAPSSSAGVMFGGVDGAYGWTWVESESTTNYDGFSPFWGSGSSGWTPGGRDSIADALNPSSGWASYTVTVPVAMSNAKLYALANGNYDDNWRWVNLYSGSISGTHLGTFSVSLAHTICESTALGALAAGDMTLTQQIGIYCEVREDGFFVTNGPLVSSGVAFDGTYYWMTAPTFSGDLPTLNKAAFTPTVTGAASDATYWVNGVQQVGGFSLIDTAGNYNLVVKDAVGDVLSGVSFNYVPVPEPMAMAMLAMGGLAMLRRRV